MRKEWRGFLAVLGIAVLAAAVALMPACDTSESCDLDLESLNGNWQLTETFEGDETPDVTTATFTVSGDTLTIDPEWDPPEVYNLDCSGDRVSIFTSETISKEEIAAEFPGTDCAITIKESISVTFSSPDAFAGTRTMSVSLSGSNCAIIEVFAKAEFGEDMKVTAEVTGTRLEL